MVKGLSVRQCVIYFHTLATLGKVGAEPSDGRSTYTVPCGESMLESFMINGIKNSGKIKKNKYLTLTLG